MFSRYVKQRDWSCTRCGTRFALEASHFHGRAKMAVRWDEDNVDAHCVWCHRHLTIHPNEHRDWKLGQLGPERFEALRQRANTIKPDLDEVEANIKRALEAA